MIIAFIIAGSLVILDQITKVVAIHFKPSNQTIIPHIIKFNFTENKGAAFSFADDNTLLLTILSLVASVIIGYFIYKLSNFKDKKLFTISLGLILGGTVGNLIDRFLTVIKSREGVIDFVDWYIFGWHFPGTFNVADIGLVVGVILLGVYLIFFAEKNQNTSVGDDKNEKND